MLDDESDLTVLRATGEQWEAFVAYGVVDQLMRVAGVSAARLRAGRDRSLPVEEPVGVGARILEALAELEQKAPVAVVVDDAQWADIDSLRRDPVRRAPPGPGTGATRARPAHRGRDAAPRGPVQVGDRSDRDHHRTSAADRGGAPATGGRPRRAAALRTNGPPPASAHGWQPAVHHLATDRDARGALAHLGAIAAGPAHLCATGHAPARRLPPGDPRPGGGGRGAGRARLVRVGGRACGRGGRWSRPSTRPSMWACCRSATTASGTSASPTRWSRPPSTSSWGPLVASGCTRGRPGSSTTRGPPCATGCSRRRPPNPGLADELEAFARREARRRGVGRCGVDPPRGEPDEC